MANDGTRFRRRKKEVLFVDGYYVDHAVDLAPGFDRADETFHIYGKDSPETDQQHNYGTLSVTVLDKYTNNVILDVLTGNNPDSTSPKQYQVSDLTSAHIWANVKDQKNTQYVKSWIMESWVPGMPVPSGDPNAKANVVITGNGGLIRQFHGAWITMDKVASGAAPTLDSTPVVVPGETNVYAVAIKAIINSPFKQEAITPVGTGMVNSAGVLTPATIDAELSTGFGTPSHYAVWYLQTGTGVYPTVKPDKLRA